MRPRSERFAIYLLLAAAYMTACHMHEHRPLRMRGPWGVPTSESRSQTAAAVEIHGHAFRDGSRVQRWLGRMPHTVDRLTHNQMVRAPPRRRAARTGRRLPACRRGGNTRMRLSARRERSRARTHLRCRIVRSCRGARPVSRRRFMKKSGHNLRVPTTSDAPKDAMYHRGGSGATDPNRTADASRRNRTRNERLRGASARGPSSIILRRCRVRTRQNTK